MVSYELVKNIDFESEKRNKLTRLAGEMKKYYKDTPDDEKISINEAVDDIED